MGQGFLPICKEDMEKRGWTQLDFVYVSGDAYVDHPSFGCCNHYTCIGVTMAIRLVLSRSRTGRMRRVCRYLESRDLVFWFLPAIWILW